VGAKIPRQPQHTLINQLGAQAGEEELGGTLRAALIDRLRITKPEAARRSAEAEDLGEPIPQTLRIPTDKNSPPVTLEA
jgi:hypothetical protein